MERTFEPGANKLTHCPMFDHGETLSWIVVAPTVIAFRDRAGDSSHAFIGLPESSPLPAATFTKIKYALYLLKSLSWYSYI